MKRDAIRSIGENIGARAVVICSLYLAYPVKQGARGSQAETQRGITNDTHRH
jgi:hypothetical protein